ncbi:unnamed protein product [Allacma fusca]|uniref:protein-serine/threonine phosphatase n=1 Tax=Allacma fusca TaxID=39272 RepID=A0A8J2JIX6_9HEXA|nr:unnamed protein product [Allacma fusca]
MMGQTLSEPVTAKESNSVQNSMFKVGSSCMQGWRVTMEDSHTHILSLPDDQTAAFFGVYDGHGGPKVAQHAGNHLHKFIVQRQEYQEGDAVGAIKQGFLEFDHSMLKDEHMRDELAGTTAVTVLIKDNKVYCGNVGDSRAVACAGGQTLPLSTDHKPNNPEEATRIERAGGWVEYNRVNGNLALSRALGDFVFKRNTTMKPEEQMVIALPDVEYRDISDDWEFILLACDGIWDVVTNEEAVEFVRRRLSINMEPETICEELMTNCLAPDCQMGGLGCDNMTVILACFLHGKSYVDLCQKIAASYSPPLNPSLPVNGNVDEDNEGDEDEDNDENEADDNTIFS